MTDAISIGGATPSGHHFCFKWMPVTISGAERHLITHIHDTIHLIIDSFTYVTLANSNAGLLLESTLFIHTYKVARIVWQDICKWNQIWMEWCVKALINPNFNSNIHVALLSSHHGNEQISILEKLSSEQWMSKIREIAISDQSCSTRKSDMQMEAIYHDMR